MAEAPKTDEAYVSADFITLHGQTQTLTFARGVRLGFFCTHRSNRKTEGRVRERESHTHTHTTKTTTGDMQRTLCATFSKCPAAANIICPVVAESN